jgi:hypothetical protein
MLSLDSELEEKDRKRIKANSKCQPENQKQGRQSIKIILRTIKPTKITLKRR